MQQQSPPTYAAIDIGSNTTQITVARCQPETLDIVAHESEMLRLGESVTKTGEISPNMQKSVIKTVQKYQDIAKQHNAEHVLAVATEAMRKARNGEEFIQHIHEKTGLPVQIINGDVEAVLTFYGATYELAQEPDAPNQVGVMDVGGGSTELITSKKMQINWRTSVQMGSGQLHDKYLHSNPPTHEEMEEARQFINSILQNVQVPQNPSMLMVTGSSASALLKLAQHAFDLDKQSTYLTQDDLLRLQGLLNAMPAEEIAKRYEQQLERARILPGGALIIHTVLGWLQLDKLRVSSHGLREGALLAYTRHGDQWLEQVNDIASQAGKGSDEDKRAEEQKKDFVQFGQDALSKSAKKFVKWKDDILKNEDVEAVHKMRVASRHLRATLDAYESCCQPKTFNTLNKRIKKLADRLGTVRDTDVMIQGLHEQLSPMSSQDQVGLQWLIDRLETYHKQQEKVLEASLQKLDEKAFRQQVKACISKGV